jgi:outer membrane lipoprotein-sorting protein
MRRGLACMVGATVAAVSCSCGGAVSTKKNLPPTQIVVAKDATREELLEKYNGLARGVKSVSATVELKPVAGSKYSGVIEEYHEVKAFVLAERPAYIRMIGQAPVIGKTVFDMTGDGESFRVSIPSKNKFLVGAISLERTSSKPIENLRPQHLLDALLWTEIRKEEDVLFEEFNDEKARYYVLTVLHGGYQKEISRKIWFNRADLEVARLEEFGRRGALLSDVRYSDWKPPAGDQEQTSAAPPGIVFFPRLIQIDRPHDDYRLDFEVAKLTLNEDIPADRFKLEQPAGSELVRVGEDAPEKKP